MLKRVATGLGVVLFLGLAAGAGPALAQTAGLDQIDRLPGAGAPGNMARTEGMRFLRPGALLLASFDRNFDGQVSMEELEIGVAGAFAAADRNSDGVISGFEQADWAAAVGSANDILSNPMTFDMDLDRSITPAEFEAGLRRIAEPLIDQSTGQIAFKDLLQPLRAPREEQAGRGFIERRPGEMRVAPGG